MIILIESNLLFCSSFSLSLKLFFWFLLLQFFIYKEIRERFSDHLWIDVVSKCDLLQESPIIFNTEDVSADNPELARYQKMGPEGAIHVSVKNEAALNQVIIVLSCLYYISNFLTSSLH